jgi:DNA polymerase-4
MSRETTFDRDLHAVRDRAELSRIFTDLCLRVAGDLQRKGYVARTFGIKLRYDDFKIATRDHSVAFYTADGPTIRKLAGQCLKRVPLDKRLRLLGVRASGLTRVEEVPAQGPQRGAARGAREPTPGDSAEPGTTAPLF